MKTVVRSNIASVKPYVPGKPIEEVQREFSLARVIKLASNENCLGASPKAVAAIRQGLRDINRYPDASSFYLKQKLAQLLGVREDMLMTTNGSDEVITIAMRTFVNAGDEVVIAHPTFLMYEIAAQVQEAVIKIVPLAADYRYDLPAMKRAITPKTKLVFLANPDNPTGTYVTKRELEEFLSGLPSTVVVVLDEAYAEFAAARFDDYPNGINYLTGRPNLIVSRSFSKAYGLAGLRIGYAIANTECISYFERVRDPFNVNILAQRAAVAALDDRGFLKRTLFTTEKEKAFLYKAFKKMQLRYITSATNFILVDVRKDCKVVFTELLKQGIIVRDMKAWGLDTFIRVTVGTRAENKQFLEALGRILQS